MSVLRLTPNSLIQIADPALQIGLYAKLSTVDAGEVIAECYTYFSLANDSPNITLILGIPSPRTLDSIVEKVVELNVHALHLFQGTHGSGKLSAEKLEQRLERLFKIRATAIKQSGGPATIIKVHKNLRSALAALRSTELAELDSNNKQSLRLVCVAPSDAPSLDTAPELKDHNQKHESLQSLISVVCNDTAQAVEDGRPAGRALENTVQPADYYLVIGPEGGLSAEEILLTAEYGFQAVTLGARVLRVETAVVAACALLGMSR